MEMRLSDVEMYISVEGRRALEVVRGVGGGFAIRLAAVEILVIPRRTALRCRRRPGRLDATRINSGL